MKPQSQGIPSSPHPGETTRMRLAGSPLIRPSAQSPDSESGTSALRVQDPVRFTVGGPVMQVHSIRGCAVRCTWNEFGCEQFGYFRAFMLALVVGSESPPANITT